MARGRLDLDAAWLSASIEDRRDFLDRIGPKALKAAFPPAWQKAEPAPERSSGKQDQIDRRASKALRLAVDLFRRPLEQAPADHLTTAQVVAAVRALARLLEGYELDEISIIQRRAKEVRRDFLHDQFRDSRDGLIRGVGTTVLPAIVPENSGTRNKGALNARSSYRTTRRNSHSRSASATKPRSRLRSPAP